jgi:hypothetical protein
MMWSQFWDDLSNLRIHIKNSCLQPHNHGYTLIIMMKKNTVLACMFCGHNCLYEDTYFIQILLQ